jgi:hypothetical protein
VPLPIPASTPPEGFCRRNAQGQLLINVYNQGGAHAAASTTRLAFTCADPAQCVSRSPFVIDVPTPALAHHFYFYMHLFIHSALITSPTINS